MTQRKELTTKEQEWLDIFYKYQENGKLVSWHLRLWIGGKTSTINYWLTKLVDKGYLTKHTTIHYTQFTRIPY